MNDKIIQPSEWSFTYKNQASNTTWVTVNSDNVYTKAHYNGTSNGCINAQYYIDLTNYTKITVVSTYFKSSWGRYVPIFVKDTNNVVEISGSWVKKLEPWDTTGTQQTGTMQTFTLDVSDLNGYYYVGWGIQGSGNYAECTVYSFVLEGVNPYKNGGIWDFDGTTDYQIGKLYDHDGTTSHQIGKVYDYDGSGSHLIYSSESILIGANSEYTTGTVTNTTTAYSNNGKGTQTNSTTLVGTFQIGCSYNYPDGRGVRNCYYTEKIDVTGFNTLEFTLGTKLWAGGYRLQIGFIPSIPTGSGYGSTGWIGIGGNAHWFSMSAGWNSDNQTVEVGTYTADISAINGEYYFVICMGYLYNSGSATINITDARMY